MDLYIIIKQTDMKKYNVTYTKKIGGNGVIMVKANSQEQAIANAKYLCFTGSDFRNATETNEPYMKPRKQGYQGSERM